MSSQARQLSIKTGVVTRCAPVPFSPLSLTHSLNSICPSLVNNSLIRDVESYKEESEQTKARADAMEAAGEDEYEVRQQVRSLSSLSSASCSLWRSQGELTVFLSDLRSDESQQTASR